jgi:hypothetical protein
MQDNHKTDANDPDVAIVLSPAMSIDAFAQWGADDVAYIKQVTSQGSVAWMIFAADGTSLGAVPDRTLAFAAATQNDRIALSAH